jgi:hypothetical protein
MYYLNVHDVSLSPNYQWVAADARLYPEGLQLMWRTAAGSQATVTLDLQFCDGKHSATDHREGHENRSCGLIRNRGIFHL